MPPLKHRSASHSSTKSVTTGSTPVITESNGRSSDLMKEEDERGDTFGTVAGLGIAMGGAGASASGSTGESRRKGEHTRLTSA